VRRPPLRHTGTRDLALPNSPDDDDGSSGSKVVNTQAKAPTSVLGGRCRVNHPPFAVARSRQRPRVAVCSLALPFPFP
jgi:hypothetical protein